jgi:hypothetical protein
MNEGGVHIKQSRERMSNNNNNTKARQETSNDELLRERERSGCSTTTRPYRHPNTISSCGIIKRKNVGNITNKIMHAIVAEGIRGVVVLYDYRPVEAAVVVVGCSGGVSGMTPTTHKHKHKHTCQTMETNETVAHGGRKK